MTSNRPLEDWGKLIGDVPAATAILDRFLHHAEVIQITGKSYRLHHAGSPATDPAQAPSSKPAKLPTGSEGKSPRNQRSEKPAQLQSSASKSDDETRRLKDNFPKPAGWF